ncbi:hypothetical protein AV654_16555 [Paenibacillus elgii]|uniref:Cytochrome C biogenesis protein transmembrane domain-containing protein n=1 Tax=Paenibacillus elgii TaxID=189691 RepID=A0A163Y9X0_9BACL|nr:hypothetical protein [Paenibacillus elgii]KZE79093.1 hypothetical protein AV654_16555 [Paenibacillus elgii]
MNERNAITADTEDSLALWYPMRKRIYWALIGIAVGVLIAGFWNYKLVDGFGNEIVAGQTIGKTSELAGSYSERGLGFGFLFASVAGLAATFTACNCVVFAMIPGLACADRRLSRSAALRAFGMFAFAVVAVCLLYGLYIGSLGTAGIEAFTDRSARLGRAQVTFTSLGIVMVAWGALAFGFMDGLKSRLPAGVRSFFARPLTQAGIMGTMVGIFSVGRPFPVFRDFLVYAASTGNPLYASLAMGVQGLGQIAFMVLLFLGLVYAFGSRLLRWAAQRPHQPRLVSSVALFIGGAYFIYYWGLARALDIGSWGFKLGWYH